MKLYINQFELLKAPGQMIGRLHAMLKMYFQYFLVCKTH